MKTIFHFSSLIILVLLSSCEKESFGQKTNTPTHNFELLWNEFDQYYGSFEAKGIDWDSLYSVYRPQVSDEMSEAEFYTVITSLLRPLNDHHITVFPTNSSLPRWSTDLENGLVIPEHFVDLDVIKKNYLTDFHDANSSVRYGWLPNKIGYIQFAGYIANNAKIYEKSLNEAFRFFASAEGLVVDIRDIAGGFDPTVQYLAGRFADERRLFMTVRRKNGPNRTDFTAPVEWYVEPTGKSQFTKPIALLTTNFTQSGGETFTLAMKTLPHVTQIGDKTSGAFSDNIYRDLYNGWIYSLTIGDYRAADGKSYEGIGLVPDVQVVNTKETIAQGKDVVIEKAIEVLK